MDSKDAGRAKDETTPTQLSLRQAFLESGWAQGSILPAALAAAVVWAPPGVAFAADTEKDRALCIVVSQDCDVVHGSLAVEPVVEVVLARLIDAIESKYTHVQDPRTLHVELESSAGAVPVAIHAVSRGHLPRERLLSASPLSDLKVGPAAAGRIAALLGRRYVRTARPEALDKRVGAKARARFKSILQAHGDKVQDIYLVVPQDQHCELPENEAYDCDVWAILTDEFADSAQNDPKLRRGFETQLKAQLRAAILLVDNAGLRLAEPEVKDRYAVSLRERDDMFAMDFGWPHFVAEANKAEAVAILEAKARDERPVVAERRLE